MLPIGQSLGGLRELQGAGELLHLLILNAAARSRGTHPYCCVAFADQPLRLVCTGRKCSCAEGAGTSGRSVASLFGGAPSQGRLAKRSRYAVMAVQQPATLAPPRQQNNAVPVLGANLASLRWKEQLTVPEKNGETQIGSAFMGFWAAHNLAHPDTSFATRRAMASGCWSAFRGLAP